MSKTKLLLPCNCCGSFTIEDRSCYEICPVCFWEDESVDVSDGEGHTGPNHVTLRAARKNYRDFGACEKEMVLHCRKPFQVELAKYARTTAKEQL